MRIKDAYLGVLKEYLGTTGALRDLTLGVEEGDAGEYHRLPQDKKKRVDEEAARRDLVARSNQVLISSRRTAQVISIGYGIFLVIIVCAFALSQTALGTSLSAAFLFGGAILVFRELRRTWATATIIEAVLSMAPGLPEEAMVRVLSAMYYAEINNRNDGGKGSQDGTLHNQ